MTTPLKIGILIDDTRVERYKIEILNELQKSDFCNITKFIKQEKNSDPETENSKYLLYRLFNKIDAKLFGRSTKYLSLEPIDHMINGIKEEEPDLIINLTNNLKHYPTNAKYGLWYLNYDSLPSGYWEVVNNDPFTKVTLQKAGMGFDRGVVLAEFKTATERKSMIKNRDTVAWRSHMMIVRELKKLSKYGEKYFEDKKTILSFDHTQISNSEKKLFDPKHKFSDIKHQAPPTNYQMIKASCKLLKKYTIFTIRKLYKSDRWLILYSETDNGKINPKLSSYKRAYAPSLDYFWADPFIVDDGEKSYLFFEELDYSRFKGYIKVSEYENGRFKEPQMVLEEDYHLSYPNVFKIEEKYYMVPESSENRTIDLYEAVEFPTKWKKKRTLIDDIFAVDATFYYHDKKWWMFVSVIEKEDFSTDDELCIFYSDDILTGDWIPHEQNPVVCDVTCSRPAGNLIEKDGRLYRPAQDCSGMYGRKMVINEIKVLSTKEYKEEVVSHISSDFADDLTGIHTLNSSKKLTVIDAIKSR